MTFYMSSWKPWTKKLAAQPKDSPQSDQRVDAVEFARTRLGFHADDRQATLLRSESKRVILNCSRQWGKTSVAAAKAIHHAFTNKKVTVLVVSPCERQSGLFMQCAVDMVRELGIKPKRDGYNKLSIVFPNGSRIVGLPGTERTVRGFSASLIIIDEAARVDDSMYKALRPMLAVQNGDLWIMSTPYGKRGFFYEIWAHGGDHWLKVSVPATECARIPKEFLEEERMESGDAWVRQEYLCEFVDYGSGVFSREMVEAAFDEEVSVLGISVWRK